MTVIDVLFIARVLAAAAIPISSSGVRYTQYRDSLVVLTLMSNTTFDLPLLIDILLLSPLSSYPRSYGDALRVQRRARKPRVNFPDKLRQRAVNYVGYDAAYAQSTGTKIMSMAGSAAKVNLIGDKK